MLGEGEVIMDLYSSLLVRYLSDGVPCRRSYWSSTSTSRMCQHIVAFTLEVIRLVDVTSTWWTQDLHTQAQDSETTAPSIAYLWIGE